MSGRKAKPSEPGNMLEGLSEVNWNSIHHAYGVATDIPPLLQALLSESQVERRKALAELNNLIHHQGTLYEATVYVAPFLIELLAAPEMPGQDDIAAIVALFAEDQWLEDTLEKQHIEVPGMLGLAKAEALFARFAETQSPDDTGEQQRLWARALQVIVGSNLHLLYRHLQSIDPDVRQIIASALALFPEQKVTSLPFLEQAFEIEEQKIVKMELGQAILKLKSQSIVN